MRGAPDVDHPKPERLLRGNPTRETWNVAERPVKGTLYTGVWRCEPGHWRIAFGPAEHELFTVLQGDSAILSLNLCWFHCFGLTIF